MKKYIALALFLPCFCRAEIFINTPQDLQNMNQNLSGDYVLNQNLDLSGMAFIPIGNQSSPFRGHFDGNGYSISNLTINLPNTRNVGLFGMLGQSAVVDYLSINNANVVGRVSTGILAGENASRFKR